MRAKYRAPWLLALAGTLVLVIVSCVGANPTAAPAGDSGAVSHSGSREHSRTGFDSSQKDSAINRGTEGAEHIRVPQGFFAIKYFGGIEHPTGMAIGPDSRLYVSLQNGEIISIADNDGDGVAEDKLIYASKLDLPLGIAFVGEKLYVSERGKITELADLNLDGISDSRQTIIDGLPVGGKLHQHIQNNEIALGPDGFLYVSIGIDFETVAAAQKVGDFGTPHGRPQQGSSQGHQDSEKEGRLGLGAKEVELGTPDERSGTIIRLRPDGSHQEVYATGFKNPLGLAFDRDGNLFATDNAPHNPNGPDELNYVTQGADYGYPKLPGERNQPGTVPVVAQLDVGSTAGLTFYYGDQFPAEFFGDAFLAQWGQAAWDVRHGNRVVRVSLERPDRHFVGIARSFAVGFEHPIKTLAGPDGSLFVADWGSLSQQERPSGGIYRIFYAGSN